MADWYLVSNCGTNIALPQTMISLGREACDVILQSKSVDKRHAVITYDHYEKRFKVKDLNSINGTYLNNARVPSHTFVKVEQLDWLRFGFVVYQVQLVERFPDKGVVDYRRLVGGWPAPTSTVVHRQPHFSPSPTSSMIMANCRDCPQKPETKEREWDRTIIGQNCCGDVTSKKTAGLPGLSDVVAIQSGTSTCDGSTTPSSDRTSSSPTFVHKSPETSSHSLKSTFSGDSLDLMSNAVGSVSLPKKPPDGLRVSVNVTKSEVAKPMSYDTRAPSFCPPAAQDDPAVDSPMTSAVGRIAAVRPPSCTAFTIEFDGDRTAATRKLDIRDSISKFAPPKSEPAEVSRGAAAGHRRNVSLSRVEDIKGSEHYSDENGNTDKKPSEFDCAIDEAKRRLGDVANSETTESFGGVPATGSVRLRLAGHRIGYASEGHVFSDQDDNTSAKSDPSRRGSAKFAGSDAEKSVGDSDPTPRRIYSAVAGSGCQPCHSQPTADLKDSARYLIDRMFGERSASSQPQTPPPSTADAKMFKSDGAVGRSDEKGDGGLSPSTKNDRKTGSHGSLTSMATYDVRNEADRTPVVRLEPRSAAEEAAHESSSSNVEDDGGEGDDGSSGHSLDDVSESGTYTIEKDVDDDEEVEARKNIDKVFGVGQFDGPVSHSNRIVDDKDEDDGDHDKSKDDDANVFDGVELRRKSAACDSETKGKNENISVKATPNWLKDWVHNTARPASASEVQVRSVPGATKSGQQVGSTGQGHVNRTVAVPTKLVSSDTPVPPQRPRRKLPVLPIGGGEDATTTMSSKQRPVTLLASPERTAPAPSVSPDGLRSDGSMDTETILKDTENVVSAMEARMIVRRDRRESRKKSPATAVAIGSRDSGGESDVDTSAASPVRHGDTFRKALKVHSSDGEGRRRRAVFGPEYGGMDNTASEVETASIHSDVSTSSDPSGSSPGSKRRADGSPVMRFNRAFSLRRARLGCESDGGLAAVAVRSASNPKRLGTTTASSRPNSAGSATSNRDRANRRPPISDKNDGGGRGHGVSVISGNNRVATAAKAGGNSFGRNDGGRFSLRLPRSAPITNRTEMAAAKVPPAAKNQTVNPKKSSSKGPANARCNSTLTSKELELKNWRRRKEYDPLKAAAEGRKKEAAAKKGTTTTANAVAVTSKSETASPTGLSFQRSASFHGTEGLDVQARRETFDEGHRVEDDDYDDDESSQFNRSSPTSAGIFEIPAYDNADSVYRCRNKKNSEDDSTSEATRTLSHTDLAAEDEMNGSPRGSPIQHAVLRHKSKIDALDNLVISTIHQLSSNLRGTLVDILCKIGDLHELECEQVFGNSGLHDLMAKLSTSDSPVSTPSKRTVSRQLAGILKNVKRLEESLQSIDRVLDLVPAMSTDRNGCHHEKINGCPQKKSTQPTNRWNGFQGGNYY